MIWADLARRLEAAALTGAESATLVPLNTCYVLVTADATTALVLAALLNSTWMRALAQVQAPLAASGFRRFNARVVESLPIPAGALEDGVLGRLAASEKGAGTSAAIDRRVAQLLDLTHEEQEALGGTAAAHCR